MEVIVTPQAKKQIKKLSKISQILITRKLKKLELGPATNVERLTSYKGVFRVRVGDYRVVYRQRERKIYVILVGHRKEIYRVLEKLLK